MFAGTLLLAFQIKAQTLTPVCMVRDSFPNITSVAVNSRFCKVKVVPSTTSMVYLTGKLESATPSNDYKISADAASGILTVVVQTPTEGFSSHVGELELAIPAQIQVLIETTSGYIHIDKLIEANLEAISSSGEIVAKSSSGAISLKSKSGAIQLTDCKGTLSTSSSGGAQQVAHCEGQLQLSAIGGALSLNHCNGTVSVSTVEGFLTLQHTHGSIQAKSGSGTVKISNCSGQIATQTLSGPVNLFEVKGTLQIATTKGNITGNPVRLEAASSFTTTEGKIKIKFGNPRDELTLVLRSENAPIIAMGTSKMKKLNYGKGAIVVTGTSTTGGQQYN